MTHTRILVTGGAGFIGSHLCRALLDQGKYVICLDNLFSGNKKNIISLLSNPLFTFIEHDITEPIHIDVDQIYNLACPASPIYYQSKPIQTIKTCTLGMIQMLELANTLSIPLLQTSTSEVYGDPIIHPQIETYWGNVNPIGPRSCYDEGKRCAETLCFDYHRNYQFPIKVARLFNTYGPMMSINDGRVVSNFITQALQKKPITLYGDGSQTRSFCYVDDLVQALLSFMNTPSNTTGPINLGNPSEFTIKQLAELIVSLTDSPSSIVYKPLPTDDPKQRQPDINIAKSTLQWEPTTQLKDGLKKTITYFKTVLTM